MNRKTLMTIAVLASLSGGFYSAVLPSAMAADKPVASSDAKKDTAAKEDFIKISEDAAITMRDVHGARLAIFDGSPDKALTYVDAAITRVDAANKDADQYAIKSKDKDKSKDKAAKMDTEVYVPFDAILTVGEGFVPTKEKMEHIAKANKHIHKGEKKQALEVLKLGQVDVAITSQLIPVKYVESRIKQAGKLVKDGKFYEANLELKAVEDAVIVETNAIDSTPKDSKS
jgi:hypothetical protein